GTNEPGSNAASSRQDRWGLAPRAVGGAARGARAVAEPFVPGSLSRRRAGFVARVVRRDCQRCRYDSAGAVRPDGGDPLRRLHHGREGGDRAWALVAASARAEWPPR